MFAEKSVRSGSFLLGYGVLIFLVLMGSMIGCSSRAPETGKLHNSGEEATDQSDSLASVKSTNQPSGSSTNAIPVGSYSPMDRAVILRYVEKGESDAANFTHAIKLIQRAEQLSHAERTMEDYLVLAAHYWFKGDMQKVVQHANQGVMAKSDSKRVKANMFIYLGYTYNKKSTTMAGSYFKQAVQIDPELYKGHYELGRIAFEKKEYPAAKVSLKKAFDLNPKDADVYGMLGQMFYGLDLYEEAVESLEMALKMSPQTHWIHLKLGDTYFYGLRERKEAGRHYQQAAEKSDSDPDVHFGVALYHRYKSEYIKAEKQLQKAMTLDKENPKYKRELDDMLSEKNEMKPAIQKYKQAIEKNPGDPKPVAQLAGYYLRWRKHDRAEEQYLKAVQVASIVPKAPVAEKDSDKPVEPVAQEPSKVPEYANSLGWFYFNDKKYDQAEEAFKMAVKINSKHSPAQFGLGRAYEQLGHYNMAASQYAKAVALNPENEEVQEHLTRLKQSGKLNPVGEMVKTEEKETGKESVLEVKK
jgi:tetratricopeptide (TPR) repeat protein